MAPVAASDPRHGNAYAWDGDTYHWEDDAYHWEGEAPAEPQRPDDLQSPAPLTNGDDGTQPLPADGPLAPAAWQEPRPPRTRLLAVILVLCAPGLLSAEEPRVRRITNDGVFKQRPAWSPDGKWLAFSRHEGAKIFLYLCTANGSEERRLTKRTDPEYDAVWSPDGKELAFSFVKTSPNQGDVEVYRIALDGGEPVRVAGSDGKLSHEESPAWSPDGKRIAFSSTRDDNQELYVADVDDGNLQRLTSDPAIDAHPAWSPDGKRIAFATNRWGDLELALLDVETHTVTRLTDSRGLDDYPAWSPDGKRIAFTSNRDGNLEIYAVDPDGAHPQNLTGHPSLDNFPAWTPDGRLTWVSNRAGGFDVYVAGE